MENVLWSTAMSCGNFAWQELKAIQTFVFQAILIHPAVASISLYHLLKVTVITIINPMNRWPQTQDSIYRALLKSSGKLVLPKLEWGNYLNHLRPSISDLCVWWVHRPRTLGPSLLVSSLWLYFVRVSCTPDHLGGYETVQPPQSWFKQEVSVCEKCLEWTRISHEVQAGSIRLARVEEAGIFCCTDLLTLETTITIHKCLFLDEIHPQLRVHLIIAPEAP